MLPPLMQKMKRSSGLARVDDLQHPPAAPDAFVVWQRVAADEDLRVGVVVSLLDDLDGGDALGQAVAEYLIHSHRHVVRRLPCGEDVDVALPGKVPSSVADVEDIAVEANEGLESLVGVQPDAAPFP